MDDGPDGGGPYLPEKASHRDATPDGPSLIPAIYPIDAELTDPLARLISHCKPGPAGDELRSLLRRLFCGEPPASSGYTYLTVVTHTAEENRGYPTNMIYDVNPQLLPDPDKTFRPFNPSASYSLTDGTTILSELAKTQSYPVNMIYGEVSESRSNNLEAVETRPKSCKVQGHITNFMYDCNTGRREEPPAQT